MKTTRQKISAMFRTEKTYFATVILHGTTYCIPIAARDYKQALIEAENQIDDCGFLVDLVSA